MAEAMEATGAVVAGRRTVEQVDHWNGDHHGMLGVGRRLFDGLPMRVELEIVRVIDTPDATHIRYRIHR